MSAFLARLINLGSLNNTERAFYFVREAVFGFPSLWSDFSFIVGLRAGVDDYVMLLMMVWFGLLVWDTFAFTNVGHSVGCRCRFVECRGGYASFYCDLLLV